MEADLNEDYISNGISKPDWIKDPETGELLPIEKDADYHEVMAEFYGSECRHPETEAMRVTIADGRTQVVKCCIRCGERVGTPLSQKDKSWVNSLKCLPPELMGTYEGERFAKKKRMLLGLARKQYADRGRFTRSYRAYMSSAEWRAKREKVMKRCEGICEGCGESPATEVHHLSYRHFMQEFLFELVGLCHECHERWHEDDHEAEEVEVANG